jgi:hypothetical protein
MNSRQHALLARTLIDACGGLIEAAAACRACKSVLSGYQTLDSGHFMRADIIADLEEYCGEPIYSRALFEARPSAAEARDLVAEACEAAESVTELQREVRLAAADGTITPKERARLAQLGAKAKDQLREALEVIDGGRMDVVSR